MNKSTSVSAPDQPTTLVKRVGPTLVIAPPSLVAVDLNDTLFEAHQRSLVVLIHDDEAKLLDFVRAWDNAADDIARLTLAQDVLSGIGA